MKKTIKIFVIAIMINLFLINILDVGIAKSNEEVQNDPPAGEIKISHKYFTAQISGEILVDDIFLYKKSLIPDCYRGIEIRGTITNMTLLNPFFIWPPYAIFQGLRTVQIFTERPIHLQIKWLTGEFFNFTNPDGSNQVSFQGLARLVNATITYDFS